MEAEEVMEDLVVTLEVEDMEDNGRHHHRVVSVFTMRNEVTRADRLSRWWTSASGLQPVSRTRWWGCRWGWWSWPTAILEPSVYRPPI